MRLWPIVLLAACSGGGPADTDTDTSFGCPDGMVQATTSGATISSFYLDGLGWTLGFDPTAVADGMPAACVSADGTALRLVMFAASDPFAVLNADFDAPGSFALSEVGPELELQVNAPDAQLTIYGGSQWQMGTLSVNTVSPLSLDIDGTAISDGHQLQLRMSAEASY